MSTTPKPVRIMKTIVGIIALAWAAVMIALYLAVSTSAGWSGDTATVWALFAGTAALIGAILTYFRKKWAVWLYLAATLAVALTPYMQGSIGPSIGFDSGYLALFVLYLVAVVPAWKHLGAGNA
jgi:LPXTG-motif cell wall-anchored protein